MADQFMNRILGAFIVIILGTALIGPLVGFVATAQVTANISATDSVLLGLITTFFVIGLVVLSVKLVISGKGKM